LESEAYKIDHLGLATLPQQQQETGLKVLTNTNRHVPYNESVGYPHKAYKVMIYLTRAESNATCFPKELILEAYNIDSSVREFHDKDAI